MHRDQLRGDAQHTALPDHLRYKPMQVPNPYRGVTPRYLEPRKKDSTRPAPKFEAEQFPRIGGWSRTTSRHLEPRAQTPPPAKVVPYEETPEYLYHKDIEKVVGFSGVRSRHLEYSVPEEGHTRKDDAQAFRHQHSRELQWRGIAINAPSRTFEEIRRRNTHLVENSPDYVPKKNKTPSVVEEYIRLGSPIRHHTTDKSYITPRVKYHMPKWAPAGGVGGGRANPIGKSPVNRSTQRSDVRVREVRAQSAERTVSRNHVPRVATLSPSYSLVRWESERRGASERSRSPTARPASPSVEPPARGSAVARGGAPVAAHADAALHEGPVTVAVPRGAYVRVVSNTGRS